MPPAFSRSQRRRDAKEVLAIARQLPAELVRIPLDELPDHASPPPGLLECWRSRTLLVQVYRVAKHPDVLRASVQHVLDTVWLRKSFPGHAKGITWDELQEVKRQIGRGEELALEVYPPDAELVNDAPMRHLWLVPRSAAPWMWTAIDRRSS